MGVHYFLFVLEIKVSIKDNFKCLILNPESKTFPNCEVLFAKCSLVAHGIKYLECVCVCDDDDTVGVTTRL